MTFKIQRNCVYMRYEVLMAVKYIFQSMVRLFESCLLCPRFVLIPSPLHNLSMDCITCV
jgi:hypothetical protein